MTSLTTARDARRYTGNNYRFLPARLAAAEQCHANPERIPASSTHRALLPLFVAGCPGATHAEPHLYARRRTLLRRRCGASRSTRTSRDWRYCLPCGGYNAPGTIHLVRAFRAGSYLRLLQNVVHSDRPSSGQAAIIHTAHRQARLRRAYGAHALHLARTPSCNRCAAWRPLVHACRRRYFFSCDG